MLMVALNASTIWIGASLLLGILMLPWRRRVEPSRFELIELIRWVAFPYLALLIGHLSPRLMGLTGQSWQTTFGVGLGVCFGLLALVFIVRVTNSSSSVDASSSTSPADEQLAYFNNASTSEDSATKSGRALWTAIRAFAHEFHWTFLRAGIWEAVLQLETAVEVPAYTAVWSAGAIAFIEIVLHRRGQTQWIWQLTTLLLTSVLFFYTRNIYLSCLLHAGIALIIPNTTALSATQRAHLRIENQHQSSPQISGPTQ